MVQRLPTNAPAWATNAGTTLEPSSGQKAAGWAANDRPPARWLNWFKRNVYQHVDRLHEQSLMDWRPGAPLHPSEPSELIVAVTYWQGHYVAITNRAANGRMAISLDGRAWATVSTSLPSTASQSAASDDSRIVIGKSAGGADYTDNAGTSFAACTGVTGSTRVGYMEQAGIWVGHDASTAVQSANGAAWTSIAGSSFIPNTHRQMAENADGSVVLLADVYSTNQGASWSFQNTTAAGGGTALSFWWSALRGEFIGADMNASPVNLHGMATAGTWDSAFAAMPAGVNFVHDMFEMHGHLFAICTRVIAGVASERVLMLSRDAGDTWELAASGGAGTSANTRAAQVAHFSGHGDHGHALIVAGSRALTPPWAGPTLAAPLT